MALRSYGVLQGRAVGRRREDASDSSPHFQIHVVDEAGTDYRIAVNVLSQQAPSELLYLAVDDFRHPITALLPARVRLDAAARPARAARTSTSSAATSSTRSRMRPLPPDVSGPGQRPGRPARPLRRAGDRRRPGRRSTPSVSGGGPRRQRADKVFGFRPGNGVHDIHMNQGNSARFRQDDGVWQDGGLLLRFPGEDRWVAIFLAFQSQAWHTDDTTGHAIDDAPTEAARTNRCASWPRWSTRSGPSPGAGDRDPAQRVARRRSTWPAGASPTA